MTVRSAVGTLILAAAVLRADTTAASVFRESVLVEVDGGQTRRLAELQADSRAQKALIDAFLTARLSPAFLQLRGEQTRLALEPTSSLVSGFMVVSRDQLDATHYRMTCEGEFDTAALVMRLIRGRVLSLGTTPPRLLLLPGPRVSVETVRAVRGVLSEAIGASGISLLAAEAVPTEGFVLDRLDPGSPIGKAALDARADFVALITWTATPSRVPVGAVIDAVLQYTLLRSHDAAIVAEQVFAGRGSGASQEVAARAALTEVSGGFAAGLSGRLAEAVFSNGEVIDRDAVTPDVILRVLARPNSSATPLLAQALREHGLQVTVSSGRVSVRPGVAADQLVVSGLRRIERLFDILTNIKLGPDRWRASVFEYGATTMAVEIVDSKPPQFPSVATASVVSAPPAPRETSPPSTPAAAVAVAATVPSGRSLRPLEFEFSAAFVEATRSRGK